MSITNSVKKSVKNTIAIRKERFVIFATVAVLVVLLFFIVGDYIQKWQSQQMSSPPVQTNAIDGTISKVEGKELTVLNKTAQSTRSGTVPTYYQVHVSDSTAIYSTIYVNYLFSGSTAQSKTPSSLADLRIGQSIIANRAMDEMNQSTAKKDFEAGTIFVLQKNSVIDGTVVRVNGSTLVIKGKNAPLAYAARVGGDIPIVDLKGKEYTITVGADTEISHMSYGKLAPGEKPQLPKPVKLTLADVKEGMGVMIYTDGDVLSKTNLKALRLDPLIDAPPAPTYPPGAVPVR